MAKKQTPRSFNDVLSMLGSQRFDVAPGPGGCKGRCKAHPKRLPGKEIRLCRRDRRRSSATAPSNSSPAPAGSSTERSPASSTAATRSSSKPASLEIPATADHLRAIHEFSEELKQVTGSMSLYNESLGTTSDVYQYDRVQGRE